VTISFHNLDSTIFHGGDYVFRLEGLTAGPRDGRAGHYRFRVAIRP
jgi:hypothetical protein